MSLFATSVGYEYSRYRERAGKISTRASSAKFLPVLLAVAHLLYAGQPVSADTADESRLREASYVKIGYDFPVDDWCIRTNATPPIPRTGHSAVWTGSEMIVWGGSDYDSYVNTGGRWNPDSNTWKPVSTLGAPSSRRDHSVIWTGKQMIIWGGNDDDQFLNDGGCYDPAADRWSTIATNNAPAGRSGQAAVWTGKEMIIWGNLQKPMTGTPGKSALSFSMVPEDGGRYDPVQDKWKSISTLGRPETRQGSKPVWTGKEIIIWGGYIEKSQPRETVYLNSGGRYDPERDKWNGISTNHAPSARSNHHAFWTGKEMIVWGGYDREEVTDGARYDPVSNRWTAMSTNDAPQAFYHSTSVWTGTEMIIWGGKQTHLERSPSLYSWTSLIQDGGRYDPATDRWKKMTPAGLNLIVNGMKAVWTGKEMVVWGGMANDPHHSAIGKYLPLSNRWAWDVVAITPREESNHTAIWTGNEMVIISRFMFRPVKYHPLADYWTESLSEQLSSLITPAGSIVWTGTELLMWGWGSQFSVRDNFGERYDPVTDVWRRMSSAGAPSSRENHTAVWTGNEMILWGGSKAILGRNGYFEKTVLSDGGRYNPASDTWTSVKKPEEILQERWKHSAIWTGEEMIIWGGMTNDQHISTGARYDPKKNQWTKITETGAPSGRQFQNVTWTGKEMIIWGGFNGAVLGDGARYNPDQDSWSKMALNNAPAPRQKHTAVWTGEKLILWGGENKRTYYSDGFLYDPEKDSWGILQTNQAPSGRSAHTAVWTGAEMIVWGGRGNASILNDGARFDPVANNWTQIATSDWISPLATKTKITREMEKQAVAMEAIEQVHYRQLLGNARPFRELLPKEIIMARVILNNRNEYLLSAILKSAITPTMLANEIRRIESETLNPKILSDIRKSLGNRESNFARYYVRPILVERELRNRYAAEDPNEKTRTTLKKLRAELVTVRTNIDRQTMLLRDAGFGEVHEAVWVYDHEKEEQPVSFHTPRKTPKTRTVYLHDIKFAMIGKELDEIKKSGVTSIVFETPTEFLLFVVLEKTDTQMKVCGLRTPNLSYDQWVIQQSANWRP